MGLENPHAPGVLITLAVLLLVVAVVLIWQWATDLLRAPHFGQAERSWTRTDYEELGAAVATRRHRNRRDRGVTHLRLLPRVEPERRWRRRA